jgi:hypothetical protein
MNIDRIFVEESDKLKQKVSELEQQIHDLEMELITLHKRVWIYFESDVDCIQIFNRLRNKFGYHQVQDVIDEYMKGQDRIGLMNRLKQKDYNDFTYNDDL